MGSTRIFYSLLKVTRHAVDLQILPKSDVYPALFTVWALLAS